MGTTAPVLLDTPPRFTVLVMLAMEAMVSIMARGKLLLKLMLKLKLMLLMVMVMVVMVTPLLPSAMPRPRGSASRGLSILSTRSPDKSATLSMTPRWTPPTFRTARTLSPKSATRSPRGFTTALVLLDTTHRLFMAMEDMEVMEVTVAMDTMARSRLRLMLFIGMAMFTNPSDW